MTSPRIALATCSFLSSLNGDDAPLVPAFAERGVVAEPVVWDDPAADWAAYDLVLIRSTWDYSDRSREFVDWTRRVEQSSRLLNPSTAVAWNIDKTYQRSLERAGLPVVPTIWLDPERNFDSRAIHTRFPASGDFVIKPTISAGSRDTGRYSASEASSRALAITHAKNLLHAGRHVMLQRYMRQVDTVGETAIIFIDGTFSHAVRKAPLLDGPFRAMTMDPPLYRPEVMSARDASPAELDVAEHVMAALPGLVPGVEGPLVYARVDLVPDNDGNPVLLELELAEPSLFFALAPATVDRLVSAVIGRL